MMMGALKRVVRIGLFAALPLGASAQLDARSILRAQQQGQQTDLYGSNPYESDDEATIAQDTARKERKIRKPLESYFFSDSVRALNNFKWHISRDYNRVAIGPLDTTLTDFRIDYPFYLHDVGDMAQGALGQTSLPLNYFRRPQSSDFAFADPYYAYTYNMENVPFYNTKRPLIRMGYIESGQKRYREENFNIMVAQNISPTTGLPFPQHSGIVCVVAHEEPQRGRRFQPHRQALLCPCRLLQQPHRAAGERRCRGRLGHRRHHVPAPFGRAHEARRRPGQEYLPQ